VRSDTRYVWPVYVVNLRARIRCPGCLRVIAVEEKVARWARQPIELGGGNQFVPWVLSLAGVPEITDERRAREDPELAVLSAMGHARDRNTKKSVEIAMLAQIVSAGLDAERSRLYFDLVMHSLPEAARRALQAMDASKYEYQSDFARSYYGKGKADGVAEGKAAGVAEITLKLLVTRFGAVSRAVQTQLQSASAAELEQIAQRVLTAQTLDEALGTR
jgi:hypothetical protein